MHSLIAFGCRHFQLKLKLKQVLQGKMILRIKNDNIYRKRQGKNAPNISLNFHIFQEGWKRPFCPLLILVVLNFTLVVSRRRVWIQIVNGRRLVALKLNPHPLTADYPYSKD